MAVNFVCDQMLGTLAKWLRLLGHDVSYPGPLDDDELGAHAKDEGRTLLTRDRALAAHVPGSLFVPSDVLDEQLLHVLRSFRLRGDRAMTRCSVCNTPLRDVAKADLKGKVPDGVFERHNEFWHCTGCGRYYWPGSHWERMTRRLQELEARIEPEAAGTEPEKTN